MIPEKARKPVAWITICGALTGACEGVRQNAYPDVTGVPTICFGETKGVKLGEHLTLDECKAMLEGRLYQFGAEVDRCTKVELPPTRKAAMVDFSYNLGTGTYCNKVAPLLNAGETQKACDRLLLYDKAGGITFPGLTKRRQRERALCLA
jgi:lysozyme